MPLTELYATRDMYTYSCIISDDVV